MEEIKLLTLKILVLQEKIINTDILNDKQIILSEILFQFKNLNSKLNNYNLQLENNIYNNCIHIYEDYSEKYERNKKKCIKCNNILY